MGVSNIKFDINIWQLVISFIFVLLKWFVFIEPRGIKWHVHQLKPTYKFVFARVHKKRIGSSIKSSCAGAVYPEFITATKHKQQLLLRLSSVSVLV